MFEFLKGGAGGFSETRNWYFKLFTNLARSTFILNVWSIKIYFGLKPWLFVHINQNSSIYQKVQSALKPFKFLYFKWFTGHVAPHVSFYTGLEASRTINPHLIVTCLIGFICIISASGQFFYGKYYLNKFHKTRETIERNNLSI